MTHSPLRPFAATLKDGLQVTVRDVTPADRGLIAAGFDQLSDQSQYFRFLAARSALTDKEMEQFSATNDTDHAAIGAICDDGQGPNPVGIARYVRSDSDPQTAEFAVTIVDAYQNRGVGTLLLGTLAKYARANGIYELTGIVARENRAMRGLLTKMGGREDGSAGPEINFVLPIYDNPDCYPDNPTGSFVRDAYSHARIAA